MNSASRLSAASRMTPAGGLHAGPPFELLRRLRDEHLEAADRLRIPRAAASRSSRVFVGL